MPTEVKECKVVGFMFQFIAPLMRDVRILKLSVHLTEKLEPLFLFQCDFHLLLSKAHS